MFEHPRSDAIDHIFAASILDNDGIDAIEMKQMTEQQPGGTGADDADLGSDGSHAQTRVALPLTPKGRALARTVAAAIGDP